MEVQLHISNSTDADFSIYDGTNNYTNMTLNTSVSTTRETTVNKPSLDTIRNTYFVLSGLIVSSGLLFNTFALMVFVYSKSLRRTTTGHYLIALSVADSTYLIGELFRWLAQPNTLITSANLVNRVDFMCKVVYFLRYAGQLTSAWITVCITIERFISIRFPLKVGIISTQNNAKITIFVTFLICGVLSLFPFWNFGVDRFCMYHDVEHFKIWIWLTLRSGTLIVPSVLVIFFTTFIIVLLKQRNKLQKTLMVHVVQNADIKAIGPKSLDKQLTMMLIAVAVAFIFLRLPYIIIYEINEYKEELWPDMDPWMSYHIYVAYKLTDNLAMTNHAINFFLYFLCGSSFRRNQKKMCGCSRRTRTHHAYQRSSMSTTMSTFFSRRSSTSRNSMSRIEAIQINPMKDSENLISGLIIKHKISMEYVSNGHKETTLDKRI